MYGPPAPQNTVRQAEQASRDHYADVTKNAARRAELGIRKPGLLARARRLFMRRKPAGD